MIPQPAGAVLCDRAAAWPRRPGCCRGKRERGWPGRRFAPTANLRLMRTSEGRSHHARVTPRPAASAGRSAAAAPPPRACSDRTSPRSAAAPRTPPVAAAIRTAHTAPPARAARTARPPPWAAPRHRPAAESAWRSRARCSTRRTRFGSPSRASASQSKRARRDPPAALFHHPPGLTPPRARPRDVRAIPSRSRRRSYARTGAWPSVPRCR